MMKKDTRITQAAAIAAAVLLTFAPATAATWVESGDADNLPGAAQSTVGPGPLTSITGTLPTESDVDMFRISITDNATFTAAITSLTTFADADIWLFDANGFGISATNLVSAGVAKVTGANVPANGDYFLAISSDMAAAINPPGAMWLPAYHQDVAPNGPGAALAITSWVGASVNNTTAYTVLLTGAEFSSVPEPGSLALLAAAPCLMLLRRKARQK